MLAFSTQQVKADEQHASDQTPENTSAVVATTTSSEAQNTVSEGVGVEKGIQTENALQQRQYLTHRLLVITSLLTRALATRLYQSNQHQLW